MMKKEGDKKDSDKKDEPKNPSLKKIIKEY